MSVPALRFVPAQPANLHEVLEAQVQCLVANGIPKEVGVDEAKFLDDAMKMAADFAFSVGLAAIGLDRVWFVHYGVRDRYLAEVGSVNLRTDPDKFTLYNGVTVPDGLQIVQGQLGLKYKYRNPRGIRLYHDPLEELGVPKEGLTAYLYWGNDLLEESFTDFPGAVTRRGSVPCLDLYGVELVLDGFSDVVANPRSGSVSRGK